MALPSFQEVAAKSTGKKASGVPRQVIDQAVVREKKTRSSGGGGGYVPASATKKVDVLTPGQFQKETSQSEMQRRKSIVITARNIQDLNRTSRLINTAPSDATFTVDGRELNKREAQLYVQSQISSQRENLRQLNKTGSVYVDTGDWEPDSRVVKTSTVDKTSYSVSHPYKGAERYGEAKRSYEESRKQHGIIPDLAVSLTGYDPLGVTSAYYAATGNKERAKNVKIRAIAQIRAIDNPLDAASYYLNMPFTQIGFAIAGGYGFGKVGAYAAGRAAGNVLATRALQVGGVALGAGLVAPAVADVYNEVQQGRPGEALGKGVTLGFSVAGGYGGAKAGMQSTSGFFGKGKGLYPSEYGYYKGLQARVGKGKLPQGVLDAAKPLYEKILPDLRLRGVRPDQVYPSFQNVESFQGSRKLPRFFERFMRKGKSEGFGGGFTEKPSTHDIDIMMRSPRSQVQLEYGIGRLGREPSSVADIKPMQRVGSMVSRGGAVKEPGYKFPTGLREMRYTEQFARVSQSSLELAHSGRSKDISESLRLLDWVIYNKTGGAPTELFPSIAKYKIAMYALEQKPYILSPEVSSKVYGSSLGKKFWDVRVKFWRETSSNNRLSTSFDKQYGAVLTESILPPSPSVVAVSPSTSGFMGGLLFRSSPSSSKSVSTTFSSPSVSKSLSTSLSSITYSSSTSKSISLSPTSPSGSRSISISKPSPSPSKTSSSSSVSKIISSSSKSSSKFFSSSFYPGSPYFDKSMYGRGSKGSDFRLFGKTKKFRSVKVTSPLKGLKL